MLNIKYKSRIILILISIIILLGFKQSEFHLYEDIKVDREIEDKNKLYYGISKVNKTLKSGENYYILIKGEEVIIKEFLEDELIIIDEYENEFIVDSNFIEIIRNKRYVTRNRISRRTDLVRKVVKTAYNELGKPYAYGDIGKKGYDCSGLVYAIYLNELNIKLPRTSSSMANVGLEISKSDLAPGDIVLFNTVGNRISHAGIYIGDGDMIHASSGEGKVVISPIDRGYFNSKYVTARRIIK